MLLFSSQQHSPSYSSYQATRGQLSLVVLTHSIRAHDLNNNEPLLLFSGIKKKDTLDSWLFLIFDTDSPSMCIFDMIMRWNVRWQGQLTSKCSIASLARGGAKEKGEQVVVLLVVIHSRSRLVKLACCCPKEYLVWSW